MSRIVKAGPGLHVGDYYAAETIDRDRVISKNPNVIEGYRLDKIRVAGKDMLQGEALKAHACACDDKVDISWLPYCADKYQISADARDFFLLSTPLIISTIPNRNMDAFPFDELTAWRTVAGTTGYL